MNKFRIEYTELGDQWDEFIRNSENGTVFSNTAFLKSLDTNFSCWQCYKGDSLQAVLALPIDAAHKSVMPHQYLVYGGVIFAHSNTKTNNAKQLSDRFAVNEFIAKKLTEKYYDIQMKLCPMQKDIRPFLWVNYGTSQPQYSPYVRYTTYLDIQGLAGSRDLEKTEFFMRASEMRRRRIRQASKKGVITMEKFSKKLFIDLYKKTLKRQNNQLGDKALGEMENILENLYKAKQGRMFISYSANGDPGSAAFFGIDNKRAYYVFGASDPELRKTDTGTAVLWDAFKALNENKVREVDLVGVNSPNRGSFKLSFGGSLNPYYELKLINND